jgi:enoyl-CoA hydratase/carnithine racemase
MLGDKVTAEDAERIGLATQVVDDLPAAAHTLARRLADGPALAFATTKVMLTKELDMSLGSAIEMEALTQALLMQTGDHREFYAAWTEGRAPAWSGR